MLESAGAGGSSLLVIGCENCKAIEHIEQVLPDAGVVRGQLDQPLTDGQALLVAAGGLGAVPAGDGEHKWSIRS